VIVTVLPAVETVALREFEDVFAVAVTVTVPLPDPDAPDETVSHDAVVDDVQPQPEAAVTVIVAAPPPAATDALVGDTVGVHVPACVTVKVDPAIVSVPVREAPVFDATVNPAVPDPVPDAPLVSVIQVALLRPVHVHDEPEVVIVTEPVPPEAAIEAAVDDSVALQGAEKENVFESSLVADPPGPTAVMRTV
jgi:hypothetical protein